MNLRRLKWVAIVSPALFLILLELVRAHYLESPPVSWMRWLVPITIMVVGVFAFSHFVFGLLARMQAEILQRNRHLTATNQILSAFAQSRDLEQVLTLALKRLMDVVEVEFGVICFLDEGPRELVALASCGVPSEIAEKMERMKLGNGLEAEVSRSGRPAVIEDAAADPRVMEGLKMLGVRSMILLPLKSKGTVRGLGFIGSQRLRKFSHLDVELLRAAGGQIAMAFENMSLFNETQKQSQRLRILVELGMDLAAELSLDALLQRVVNFSRDLVGARFGALSVLEREGKIGRFLTSGLSSEEVARIGSPPRGLGLLGLILKEGRPLRLSEITAHPSSVGFPPGHPAMKSLLGVPMVSRGTVIGSLYLADKEDGHEFTGADQDGVAMLAAQAAVAIENARLYEQLEDLARLRERERIAMDLHDGVIQSIYAIGLNLEGCVDLNDEDPQEMEHRVLKAVDGLNEVIREIRNYIFDLRLDRSGTKTLKQVLEDAAKELRLTALIEADVITEGPSEEPSTERTVQLSYIVREAIANIIKHAKATSATLRLSARSDHFVLSVRDNGVGFGPEQSAASSGQGLRNMMERAREIGGNLAVTSGPGVGTEVAVTLQLVRNEEGRGHG